MPSERLRSTLTALQSASDWERPKVVAGALRDQDLGRELWRFAKAVGERFGEAPRLGHQPEGEQDFADGLSSADRARLPELRPLLDAGRLAAREVGRIEQLREERRLTRTLDLSQEQGLGPE